MYKKILLIDDDEDEQFFFMEALKEIDGPIKFFFAANSDEGIRMLEFLSPDIVFIDINMPAINGLECLELIRNNKNVKEVRTIIYSTGVDDNIRDKAKKKGAIACIKKQGSIHDLANMIRSLLLLKAVP
jgi:CheY-like chemotaxis protein